MYFNYVIPALSCCSINEIDSQWEEMRTKSSVSRPTTPAPSTTGLASGSAAAGESTTLSDTCGGGYGSHAVARWCLTRSC
jgi:hypothetical protein